MTIYVLTRLQFDGFLKTNDPEYTDIEDIFVSKDDARRYIYEEFAKFDQTPTYEGDDYYSGLDTGWKKIDFSIEEHELIGTKWVRISDNPPAPCDWGVFYGHLLLGEPCMVAQRWQTLRDSNQQNMFTHWMRLPDPPEEENEDSHASD